MMHHLEPPNGHAKVAARPSIRVFGLAASALVLLIVFVACSHDSPTGALPAPTASELRDAVTGAAAAAIGSDGKIRLAPPRPTSTERELTAVEAGAFALAWVREYAPMTSDWLEKTHGAPITFKTLASCGRPLYARSALDTPPQTIPGPYRRVHGSWWLLTYCDAANTPSVSVAISAWATELTLEKGKLRFPKISGTEIVAVGIPIGHLGEYPSAPEHAIALAARQTGKRVSEVPELITPLQTQGPPQLARWRLTLDGPAMVRTPSGQHEAREIYVSPTQVGVKSLVASVATIAQPQGVNFDWMPQSAIGERVSASRARPARQVTKLTRRIDTSVQLEPISASENH